MSAGVVASLWRYPVKSMQGEPLGAAELGPRGLLGDRAYALVDLATGHVASAKHPGKWAALLACRAAYAAEPAPGAPLPPVLITLPSGVISSAPRGRAPGGQRAASRNGGVGAQQPHKVQKGSSQFTNQFRLCSSHPLNITKGEHTVEEQNIYDLGLQADIGMLARTPVDRRRILKLGAIGIGVLLAGCGASAPSTGGTSATSTSGGAASSTAAADACVAAIPGETAGPYPADGSRASGQALNALAISGIVRGDIRTSLGTGNTAAGVPNVIELTIVNSADGCTPLAGYAVYAWHCDRDGNYSMYSSGVTDEDYLRGVQVADSAGKVRFSSIYPGCYAGRWPHVHFEIYPSLERATASSNAVHTSQLAFPEDVCKTVYATDGYSASVRNLSQISLATDNVFSDGVELQMATMAGDVAGGFTAKLTMGVQA